MSAETVQLRTLPEGFVAERLAALRKTTEADPGARETGGRQALQNAAGVLAAFDPARLVPVAGEKTASPDQTGALFAFLADCEPIPGAPPGAGWRLKPGIRRPALRRLGSRERMRAALSANPDRATSALQRMLEALIDGAAPAARTLGRDELAALIEAISWLEGILDGLPDRAELESLLAHADLTEPLRRLVGARFVGRQREQSRLAAYLSEGGDGPLQLYGPGGVGKSTLLAQFILEHAVGDDMAPRPFVRLDADHPGLSAVQPLTFVAEALRQLAVQLPSIRTRLLELGDSAVTLLDRVDALESAKVVLPTDALLSECSAILRPVLDGVRFVLAADSFEAVQIIGDEAAEQVIGLLTDFARAVPEARVVVSGRVPISGPGEQLRLEDLETQDAVELINAEFETLGVVPTDGALGAEIVRRVGGNPMCLRFAAQLVAQAGKSALDKGPGGELLERVGVEARQALLYGRILSHLRDLRVRALALPSVVLRRIDAAVIRHVLAGPCNIEVPDDAAAEEIFREMLREVALVEYDRDDRSLRHRPDVREAMLASLASEVHVSKLRVIEDGAIAFYTGRDGPRARAEELYHRLRRGDPPSALRWDPGASRFLSGALPELPLDARVWLAERLDISIGGAEREQLQSDADWTAQALRVAERLLLNGRAAQALTVLRERPISDARLVRLEAQALVLLGQLDEAEDVALRGAAAATGKEQEDVRNDLLRHIGEIRERKGDLTGAADVLSNAVAASEAAAGEKPNDVLVQFLKTFVVFVRVLRKLGDAHNAARGAAIQKIIDLLRELPVTTLREQPVLTRELAAEIGHLVPDLLARAVDTVGLELDTKERADAVADLLVEHGAADQVTIEAMRKGDRFAFQNYAQSVAQRYLASAAPKGGFTKSVVNLFRSSVEHTLGKLM